MKPVEVISHMPLSFANICIDCDTIYSDNFHSYCPICTGKSKLRIIELIQPIERNLPEVE